LDIQNSEINEWKRFGDHIELMIRCWTFRIQRDKKKGSGIASANATGGEQEPVDEDALALVLQVVRQQAVPLVLLFAAAVAVAALRGGARAHLLVDHLREFVQIHDGKNFAGRITGPIGGDNFHFTFARVFSATGDGLGRGLGHRGGASIGLPLASAAMDLVHKLVPFCDVRKSEVSHCCGFCFPLAPEPPDDAFHDLAWS